MGASRDGTVWRGSYSHRPRQQIGGRGILHRRRWGKSVQYCGLDFPIAPHRITPSSDHKSVSASRLSGALRRSTWRDISVTQRPISSVCTKLPLPPLCGRSSSHASDDAGHPAAHIAEDMGCIWNYNLRGFTLGHQRNSRKAAPAAATAENWLLPAERLGFSESNFAYLLAQQQILRN